MDAQPSNLITRLRDYCAKKTGSVGLIKFGEKQPSYHILGGFLDSFAGFQLDETPIILTLRCPIDQLEKFKLQKSAQYHWDTVGWEWVDVPLDGNISETQLYQLIDTSYALCISGFNQHQRDLIELSGQTLTFDIMIEKLIDQYNLNHRKADIQAIITKQIWMKTDFANEIDLALGQSKIGGSPDLPINWKLPTYEDKPLAFVAQVNLDEIPMEIRSPLLPQKGILYFFSVWAWQLPNGDLHPDINWEDAKNPAMSQVLYFAGDEPLTRYPLPNAIKTFQPASVTFIETPSFPRAGDYCCDIALHDLSWTEDEFDRFDELGFDFKFLLQQTFGRTPEHKLLGYADTIQNRFVEDGWRLLCQIDSDYHQLHTDMMFGDGGIIYFMIQNKNLTPYAHDFSRILSELQMG
ncbi:MAG: DUF1963 domain-containing protein [bacterium]|nr:DUF1963 domain-containing protein [bacterium]